MNFYKEKKNNDNPDGKKYSVYMKFDGDHYICDMIDGGTPNDVAANELGLTLRARLIRSKGKYAMLEGTVFNPERLLEAACEITDFIKKEFSGGEYKKGYTLLTIQADGCINKYMIFSKLLLDSLIKKIEMRIKSANK